MFPFSQNRNIESLLKIFLFDNKKDLKKHCKSITIHMDDFINLIGLCETFNIGLKHRIYQRDIIPHELSYRKNDIKENKSKIDSNINIRGKKLFQFFRVRRYLIAHVFYIPPGTKYWHFFYFDQRDMWKKETTGVTDHIFILSIIYGHNILQKVYGKSL